MTLELSNWFWEGVMMQGGVLSIDRAYFDITGARERWLYRVARKHAGGAGEGGFAISMPVLFEKSGAEGKYRRFKFEMLKLAEKNTLPGYSLSVETSQRDGEPMLRMTRVGDMGGAEESPPRAAARIRGSAGYKGGGEGPRAASEAIERVSPRNRSEAQYREEKQSSPRAGRRAEVATYAKVETFDARSLVRSAVAGLSDKATRGFMTEETIEYLRRKCPGWDLYALHAEFERWVAASPERTPANWQKAFIGWVKRHHEKRCHELRG
jgi:hypothetical protein